jgi:hypothetical protein
MHQPGKEGSYQVARTIEIVADQEPGRAVLSAFPSGQEVDEAMEDPQGPIRMVQPDPLVFWRHLSQVGIAGRKAAAQLRQQGDQLVTVLNQQIRCLIFQSRHQLPEEVAQPCPGATLLEIGRQKPAGEAARRSVLHGSLDQNAALAAPLGGQDRDPSGLQRGDAAGGQIRRERLVHGTSSLIETGRSS